MTDEKFDAFGLNGPGKKPDWLSDPTPEEISAAEAADPGTEMEEAIEANAEAVNAEETPVEEPIEVEVPAETETISEQDGEQPETPVEEQTVEELIFGKYKDLEAAQKGYDNLRDLQRRTAERASQYEREHDFLLERAKELEATLQQAIPYIQQLEQARAQADPYAEAPQASSVITPQQVDLITQMRVQEQRQAWEAERQQQEQLASQREAVNVFLEAHPELEEGSELDNELYEAYTALNGAWERADTEVNLGDPATLEILLETTKNPELLKILQMRPEYIDTDEGMQLARLEAAMLKGNAPNTQQTRKVPASEVGKNKLPVTESASVGGAPPPEQPMNEWDRVKQARAVATGKGTGSPFFE